VLLLGCCSHQTLEAASLDAPIHAARVHQKLFASQDAFEYKFMTISASGFSNLQVVLSVVHAKRLQADGVLITIHKSVVIQSHGVARSLRLRLAVQCFVVE
jgi:hypothetical protein